MLSFAIFAVVLYGMVVPGLFLFVKYKLKNTLFFQISKFLVLFLSVISLLYYLAGTLGVIHLVWIVPVTLGVMYGSFILARKFIANTFSGLNETIKSIASGNLSQRFSGEQETKIDDGFSEIYKSLDRLVVNQSNVTKKLIKELENTQKINREVTQRVSDIFERVNSQASTLEEISSSMEEMLSSIEQNTSNSKQTESIANKTSSNISVVNKAVEGAIASVNEIISKTSIINEFAMKTNLLSLNAAVEAANAGEYGKGFSVVAAEVRKLAENSKNTSNEISVLTTKSLKTFDRSTKLLETVIPEIQKTANLVQDISTASEEQLKGAEQINSAMQQLNTFTQDNTAAWMTLKHIQRHWTKALISSIKPLRFSN